MRKERSRANGLAEELAVVRAAQRAEASSASSSEGYRAELRAAKISLDAARRAAAASARAMRCETEGVRAECAAQRVHAERLTAELQDARAAVPGQRRIPLRAGF